VIERIRGIPRKLGEEGVKLPDERKNKNSSTWFAKSFWASFPKKTQSKVSFPQKSHLFKLIGNKFKMTPKNPYLVNTKYLLLNTSY